LAIVVTLHVLLGGWSRRNRHGRSEKAAVMLP